MQLGICCGTDQFETAKRTGFDYAEPSVQTFRSMDNNELKNVRKNLDDIGFRIDGFNCFFSGDVSLYCDSTDSIVEYAKRNFEIANCFDSDYCVIGSGRARSIPVDMEREKAEYIFMSLVNSLADTGAGFGIKLYIEPLNYNETNYINTLSDAIRMKRELNNCNVGCLVDFFHFFKNKENNSEFDLLREGELTHVHLARPNDDRDAPVKEDCIILSEWSNILKKLNYNGRISLECLWKNGMENSIEEAFEQLSVFL